MRRVEAILVDELSLARHPLLSFLVALVLQRKDEIAAIQLGPLVYDGRIQTHILQLQRLDAGEQHHDLTLL